MKDLFIKLLCKHSMKPVGDRLTKKYKRETTNNSKHTVISSETQTQLYVCENCGKIIKLTSK